MQSKPWYTSKTLWLNLITILVASLTLAAQMPELRQFAPWLLLIVGVCNIVLRVLFTEKPIG